MATELPPRPRQLTVAAGVVIGGSVFLVAAVFDSLANVQSVETREQLQDVVSSAAGRELGVTLDQTVSAVQATLNLTAVCAAIAAVLGVFVLQRHRGARIGLTVLAVPLLLTAPLAGGFLGAVVAVASLTLWSGPAGDWYAGRPIRTPQVRGRRDRDEHPQPPAPPDTSSTSATVGPPGPPAASGPSTLDTSTTPEATQGFGTAVDPFAAAPPQEQAPSEHASAQPTQATPPGTPGPAPASVRLACFLTWGFSGLVSLLYLAALVALLVNRSAISDRVVDSPAWKNAGLPDDALVPMLWFGVLLFLAWSLGAVVLAWFTWRRHDWARYLLAVSAGLALLIGLIAFPVGLLHQIACAATIAGLFNARARAWFAGRGPAPTGQPPTKPW